MIKATQDAPLPRFHQNGASCEMMFLNLLNRYISMGYKSNLS